MAYTTLNKMVTVFIKTFCGFINDFILWRRIHNKKVVKHQMFATIFITLCDRKNTRWVI